MSNAKVIDKSGWNYTIVDNEIVETEKLDIYEKMLYIALKRFANIQTGKAFPGVKRLSEMAGMSHRKAQLVISSLVDKNFIAVDYRGFKTSLYTILPIPSTDALEGAHDAGEGAHHAGEGAHAMHPPHAPHAPELKKEELKRTEQQKDNYKDNVADASVLPFEKIVDYLNQKTGKAYRFASKKTQSLISARFNEGFTVEDFKNVIDIKTQEWLNDSKFQVYLQPSTLFGPKFENYLNQKPKGATTHAGHQSTPKKSNDTSGLHW